MSQLVEFEVLNNTRDLGGMTGACGGTIKPGMLYRSGHLFKSSHKDKEKLESLKIERIYDLRSFNERAERPDPVLEGTDNFHIPVEDEEAIGIVRDEKSDKKFAEILIERVIDDKGYALEHMSGMYKRFVTHPYTINAYKHFLDEMLECSGPVLWHCTAGKDRAGFASILMEEILGVPREEIIEDYLKTNDYLADEVEFLVDKFSCLCPEEKTYPREEVKLFFAASEGFIMPMYETAEREYGGFRGFMLKALDITDAKVEQFREKYMI